MSISIETRPPSLGEIRVSLDRSARDHSNYEVIFQLFSTKKNGYVFELKKK